MIDKMFAQAVMRKIGTDKEEHALLLETLFAHSRQGHLALDLSTDAKLQKAAETLPQHAIGTWIYRLGTKYYLERNWKDETQILIQLERIASHLPLIPIPDSPIDPCLNAEQRKGVENTRSYSLSLLTGGPGTGKTFTAAHIVKSCPLPRIILAAPTGKAVAQLEGNLKSAIDPKTSLRSGTLHALLGIKEGAREEEEVLPLFADLIIVDECSMIDARVFARLLAAIPTGSRLVLIGDKDQLPPVEAGSIFADLIDAGVYPSSQLVESLRSDRQEIHQLAQAIREGNASKALECLEQSADIRWLEKIEPQQLWDEYGSQFQTQGKFTLLSTMRQGPLGVDALNRFFLTQSLKRAQGDQFSAPIMIARNDYDLDVYNGDLGVLTRKFTDDFSLRQFHLDDYILLRDRKGGMRKISALSVASFDYSYCLSVHKSQGSEYDEALILMPSGSEQFGREVLYTAITRVRRRATLVCSKELFVQAVASSSRKISGIGDRLK